MASSDEHIPEVLPPGSSADELRRRVRPMQYSKMGGKFAVSEYILARVLNSPHDVAAVVSPPPDFQYSVALWIYEHMRRLCVDLGHLIAAVGESACTLKSCPKMCVTSEFEFLCAAHKENRACCAIDYSVHTLEGTVSLLNSKKAFPNKLDIGREKMPQFSTMLRRLYRILAHMYFHHERYFWEFEVGPNAIPASLGCAAIFFVQ